MRSSRPAARGVVWAAVGDFFREGDAFPLERGLQRFLGEKELLFGFFWRGSESFF